MSKYDQLLLDGACEPIYKRIDKSTLRKIEIVFGLRYGYGN